MLTSSSEQDLLSAVTAFTLKRHFKGFYWESNPCVASYPQTRAVTDARGPSSPVVRTPGDGASRRGGYLATMPSWLPRVWVCSAAHSSSARHRASGHCWATARPNLTNACPSEAICLAQEMSWSLL